LKKFKKESDKYIVEVDPYTKWFLIKDLEGNVVLDITPSMYTPYFLEDTLVLKTSLKDVNDSLYTIINLSLDKKHRFPITCKSIRLLPNNNIIAGNYKNTGKMCVVDTKTGVASYDLLDYIGDVQFDEESSSYYLPARIDVSCANSEVSSFSLYGKIDMNGNFISPIYNSVTEEALVFNKDGLHLSDEINRTEEYIKMKRKSREEQIKNLPIITPYKINH
jgi:hypothetical protein